MRSRHHMIRVLVAIYRMWRAAPEQRLAQVMANNAPVHGDLFYVEDDAWFAGEKGRA